MAVDPPRNRPATGTGPDIVTGATFLRLEPGFYAVEFRGSGNDVTEVGLPVPCARLEPLPHAPGTRTGQAFVTTMPEGGWLSHQTRVTHVLVVDAAVGAVLTTYRFANTPPPEVEFRFLMAPDLPSNKNATPGMDPSLDMTVHVATLGDVTGRLGGWVGDLGDAGSVEGFSITLPAGFRPDELQCQAIMGPEWRTPWVRAGEFCGSRGMQLELAGFCLRLAGDAAQRLDFRAWGRFGDGQVVGPVGNGDDCKADNLPLRAMKIELTPKFAG